MVLNKESYMDLALGFKHYLQNPTQFSINGIILGIYSKVAADKNYLQFENEATNVTSYIEPMGDELKVTQEERGGKKYVQTIKSNKYADVFTPEPPFNPEEEQRLKAFMEGDGITHRPSSSDGYRGGRKRKTRGGKRCGTRGGKRCGTRGGKRCGTRGGKHLGKHKRHTAKR